MREGKTGLLPERPASQLRGRPGGRRQRLARGPVRGENVAIQPGGKPTRKFYWRCSTRDEVLYPSPGYPITSRRSSSRRGAQAHRYLEGERTFTITSTT